MKRSIPMPHPKEPGAALVRDRLEKIARLDLQTERTVQVIGDPTDRTIVRIDGATGEIFVSGLGYPIPIGQLVKC